MRSAITEALPGSVGGCRSMAGLNANPLTIAVQVSPFFAAVEPDFFADPEWMTKDVRRRGSFQFVDRESMLRAEKLRIDHDEMLSVC